jgi:hypothetical protein
MDENKTPKYVACKATLCNASILRCTCLREKALGYMGSILTMIRTAKEKKK